MIPLHAPPVPGPSFRLPLELLPRAAGDDDLARVGLQLGDRSLSAFHERETGRVRDWIVTSPTALALWFVDHWWRLRWEPIRSGRPTPDWRLRHELSSASSSRLWPALMIYGAGDRMVFAPAAGAPSDIGPLRYLEPPVSVCAGTDYEAGLDAFFAAVRAEALRTADADLLGGLLDQLAAERADPEMAAWRRLEARLGYDPDAAPETVMESLARIESGLGVDAVEEAAVAAPGPQAVEALETSVAAARSSAVVIDLALARGAPVRSALPLPPWRKAEDAAWHVRERLGRPTGPLLARALADAIGVRWDTVVKAEATARTLPYAARLARSADKAQLSLQTRASHDRRFELARALGDAVWDSEARFAPLTKAKTDRQKFSRAFAQSLLCPFEELRQQVTPEAPSEAEMHAAARRFHVNVGVVRTLLVNKGLLPRETLEERLEAA